MASMENFKAPPVPHYPKRMIKTLQDYNIFTKWSHLCYYFFCRPNKDFAGVWLFVLFSSCLDSIPHWWGRPHILSTEVTVRVTKINPIFPFVCCWICSAQLTDCLMNYQSGHIFVDVDSSVMLKALGSISALKNGSTVWNCLGWERANRHGNLRKDSIPPPLFPSGMPCPDVGSSEMSWCVIDIRDGRGGQRFRSSNRHSPDVPDAAFKIKTCHRTTSIHRQPRVALFMWPFPTACQARGNACFTCGCSCCHTAPIPHTSLKMVLTTLNQGFTFDPCQVEHME